MLLRIFDLTDLAVVVIVKLWLVLLNIWQR